MRAPDITVSAIHEYDSMPFQGTSDDPRKMSFDVTGIRDDKYGLTTFSDVVGSLTLEWKQQGIPGFPYESIILEMIVGILLLWWLKKRV